MGLRVTGVGLWVSGFASTNRSLGLGVRHLGCRVWELWFKG